MVIDEKSKNKDVVVELAEKYEVKKIVVFAYHFKSNRMIECDYKPIVDALSKMSVGGSINWI